MPRLPEVDLATLPDDVRAALRERSSKLGALTWQRVMAHRPRQMLHVIELMDSFSTDSTLPKRLVEVAVVTVSKLNECRHCVGRHAVRLVQEGLSAQAIDAILDPEAPLLTAEERLVRDYAVAVTERADRLRDALFDRLRAQFSEAQIVELTLRIGLAGFFNRFNNALQVDLDEQHGARAAELGLAV